jgi:hypothetical protein
MRPNLPSQMAHRFAASRRRYWGLLRIFLSCGLAWVVVGEHPLLAAVVLVTRL